MPLWKVNLTVRVVGPDGSTYQGTKLASSLGTPCYLEDGIHLLENAAQYLEAVKGRIPTDMPVQISFWTGPVPGADFSTTTDANATESSTPDEPSDP